MRLLAAGGGSGGHVTPVKAVINELARHDDKLEVYFISDRKFGAEAERILQHADTKVGVRRIFAGKIRRYYGVPMWRQLLDIPTVLHNVKDLLLVGIGTMQSVYYVMKWKPDVIFTKGGFVCLPVGLAGALLKIPIVVHDSDAHPGLTNRVLARFATRIATGAPLENYQYPAGKTHYVGIPVDAAFHPLDKEGQDRAKATLDFSDMSKPLVVVTGGGLGAKRVNLAMLMIADTLVKRASVLHITGAAHGQSISKKAPASPDYKVVPFVHKDMANVLASADVVVTRAGATTLAELASLGKPTIIIPNAMLTGGHQTKNALVYEHAEAAEVLDEKAVQDSPPLLLDTILKVIEDREYSRKLSKNIQAFAKPDAALDTARLIVNSAHYPQKEGVAKNDV
jgi:UDP-N-acetylglucosamine--N-acetylmuramyl-(pentapeptide) pyrophosphoryl-undecaprenol N-acetylglucosamine transferase